MSFIEDVLRALDAAGVRAVVVGGVAVVLQGHPRATIDLDLVVDLEPSAARTAMDTLTSIGLRPTVPVDARDFADPGKRSGWIRDKHMQAFPMRDPDDIARHVDVFVSEPVPFDELWARSDVVQYRGIRVRVASIADLIAMKAVAGRPQDLADIEALRRIEEMKRGGS